MLNKVGRDIPTNIPALEGREVYQGEFAIEPKAKRATSRLALDGSGFFALSNPYHCQGEFGPRNLG